MINQVSKEKAIEIYSNYMVNDFEKSELPDLNLFIELYETKRNIVYMYSQDRKELGYFITMEDNDGRVMITYLAVVKEFRGHGIGRKFLNDIIEFFKDKKLIIVEVESEKMAKDEKSLEIIQKRQRYYLNSGFKKYDKIDYRLFGIIYDILIYHIKDKETTNEDITETIKKIYGKKFCDKNLYMNILK